MKLSEELTARGFVHQYSAADLAEIVDGPPRVVYHGIDPTADSAHAGNFVNWMLLRHLVTRGHRIIFLVGGGTGMIGDPKPDVERPLLSQEEIVLRVEKIARQARSLLGEGVVFVNNHEWLSEVTLIDFLRDTGKHFTVNELVKKDAIARRLQSEIGLSYTEFAYPLLQAYDYLVLHRLYGCDVQVGGSDQWGNIVAGVDLIRRIEHKTVYALTTPLIIDKTTGKKFGKSEGNAVWLDATKTSPYHFYQFWFNATDESVVDYLKLFTTIPLVEIGELEQRHMKNPGARVAQACLAQAVTAFVHGGEIAAQVERVSRCLFGEVAVADLSSEEQTMLRANAPMVSLPDATALLDALVAAQLATSKREARTLTESGAVSIGGKKVSECAYLLTKAADGPLVHLRRGKKHVALVALE